VQDLTAEAIPEVAYDVAEAFRAAGFRIWLVGGWVRDALLGHAEADLDFATDARPDDSLKILRTWSGSAPWTTGMEFGTVGVQQAGYRIEVTTLRKDVYQPDSRNPRVGYGDDIETDLSRRDFSINAIAIELPDIEVQDPFGGLSDLVARRIRTPLEASVSFSDDPLRMLRALRFASTLGFEVDAQALEAISAMHDRLQIISKERIRDEFIKLLLGEAPSRALELASQTHLADEFLPELPELKLEQDPIHRHKDVFHHTLAVLDNVIGAEAEGPDLVLRLAALTHDIGKPRTREYGPKGVSFHHHEVVGAQMTEARLKELRFPARVVEDVRELVYLHLRFHTFALGWSDRAVRRYVRDAGDLLWRLNRLVRADCTTRNPARAAQLARRMDSLEERVADLASKEELMALRPALDGRQVMEILGIGPSRLVGEALAFLMEIRLDEGEIGEAEAIERLEAWHRERNAGA
jgi:poly(A) polymerase